MSPTVGDTPTDFQQLASVLKDEITSGISTIVESAVAKYAEKQQTVRHLRKDVIGHMTSASLLRHHSDTCDIVINDLSSDAAAGLFPARGYPFSHSDLSLSNGLQPTDVFSALYKHDAATAVKDQRPPYLLFPSVLGIDGGKRESESPRSGEGRRGGDSLLQQLLADDSDLFEQDSSESNTIVSLTLVYFIMYYAYFIYASIQTTINNRKITQFKLNAFGCL